MTTWPEDGALVVCVRTGRVGTFSRTTNRLQHPAIRVAGQNIWLHQPSDIRTPTIGERAAHAREPLPI